MGSLRDYQGHTRVCCRLLEMVPSVLLPKRLAAAVQPHTRVLD
jgi:hypothetical protein